MLLAIVVLATWGANLLKDALNLSMMPSIEKQVHRTLMTGMVAYVGLLSLPFVPGAEIGIAMLTLFGKAIAPLVYSATVLAMMLSYTLGRFLPPEALARFLASVRLLKAAEFLRKIATLSQDERVALVMEGASPRLIKRAIKHRYIALALSVNIPGNSLIGGGGGIMMLAGISGLFAPVPTFIAIAIAVSPVPIFVMLFGA